MSHKLVSLYIGDGEYYTRIDADAVIAELKAQKAQAEDDCAYWKMREGNAVNAMHETEEACMFLTKSERHQKHKRCLDKAKWCESEYKRLEAKAPLFDIDKECWEYNSDYWYKWHKRWLELAEKFKTNSTAQ